MIKKLKLLLKRDFIKSFLTLFTGSVIAQAIVFGITPILSRQYSEELFGVFFTFSAICMIMHVLAALRLEVAIVLPEKDEDAVNLVVAGFMVVVAVTFVSLILVVFGQQIFYWLFEEEELNKWLIALPISTFFIGIFRLLTSWNIRKNQYKEISYSNIHKSLFMSAIQLGMGVFSFNYFGLIFGLIGGQIASAMYFIHKNLKELFSLKNHISFQRMKALLVQYKAIPIYSTLNDFLNMVSGQLPLLMLTPIFGLTATAWYGMANRIVSTPTGLIGQSVSQIFYKKASDCYNQKSGLYQLVISTYKGLLKVAVIPFLFFAFTAPFIFRVFFGEEWEEAGKMSQLLLPWLFLAFLNAPVSGIFTVINKLKPMLIYNIVLFIFRFATLYFSQYYFRDLDTAIFLYGLVGFLFNAFFAIYIIYLSKKAEACF